jgi:hypothetical protein
VTKVEIIEEKNSITSPCESRSSRLTCQRTPGCTAEFDSVWDFPRSAGIQADICHQCRIGIPAGDLIVGADDQLQCPGKHHVGGELLAVFGCEHVLGRAMPKPA